MATRPAGSRAPLDVKLSVENPKKNAPYQKMYGFFFFYNNWFVHGMHGCMIIFFNLFIVFYEFKFYKLSRHFVYINEILNLIMKENNYFTTRNI